MSVTEKIVSTEDAIRRLMSRPEMTQLVRDIYADDDVMKAAMRFARSEEFLCVEAWARQHGIVPPARVLDVGAGRGIASLAWSVRGYRVIALEPDPSDLIGSGAIEAMVDRTGLPIVVAKGMGEATSLDAAAVDLVYARQVLHHAQDLKGMCREIARVLRPGGMLIATREHVVASREELEAFWDGHVVHHLTGGEMAYSLSQYREAFRSAGLRLLRVRGPWDSVVNYYPVKRAEVLEASRHAMTRRFGQHLGQALAALPVYFGLWSSIRSRRDKTPGRMYSFVVTKPSDRKPRR